ncbi:hypothetical protein SAMN04488009_3208 [Maribacter sedimenticola]|uniref:Uncharacterized protein n=1 Tax=Maribacter sedimenticola TaxID=228956 RepID=A0ABY1SK93_9FLAO|nr:MULTISPECIES: hypothetical protein [Maribacter]TVZ17352.1 hypothetical protein JM81_3638 [Maribacter sp. MAR_2009_72]SNR68834.1 hypothetical protein SAMN04488009_3208 [Maribacter sedimenticola]
MKLKHKVLILNFVCFAVLFVILRFGIGFVYKEYSFFISLISAIAASLLAPKFALVNKEGKEKMVMKWIFIKGFRVL